MGREVDNFIKFLTKAKQKCWQILPVTPVDFVNSPYASSSAFAGNYMLIDLEDLLARGLIDEDELATAETGVGNDYGRATRNKLKFLRIAYYNFFSKLNLKDFYAFCDENKFWLDDYALFSAIKKNLNGAPWYEWEEDIKLRSVQAVEKYSSLYEEDVDYYKFEQFIFYSQWRKFREKVAQGGITLIGDMPIYVGYDSADVWANREMFLLDKFGTPKLVAGVPPDDMAKGGQLWGNPIYDWKQMSLNGYDWWKKRIINSEKLYDCLRIDHFRAFNDYYVVKNGSTDAIHGKWIKGSGLEFVKILQGVSDKLILIAEDLGSNMLETYQLREKAGIPGMKVMIFAFDGSDHIFLPHNYEQNCVAYLGTHDNETTAGWYENLSFEQKKIVTTYCHLPFDAKTDEVVWNMIERLENSPSDTVIVSLQDVNVLNNDYRMNIPSKIGCWKFMAEPKHFSNGVAERLAELTTKASR